MAGATDTKGGFTRPFRPITGDPEPRVLHGDEEIRRSSLPPIEVKVNQQKSSEKLDIGSYEKGTGRS